VLGLKLPYEPALIVGLLVAVPHGHRG